MTGDGVELTPQVVEELRAGLPEAAARTVEAVTDQVPEYGRAGIAPDTAPTIEAAVGLPPGTFRRLPRAERAGWSPPETITVIVLRSAHLAHTAQLLDVRTLRLAGDLAPGLTSDEVAVLLVPDAHRSRAALQAALSGRGVIMGPPRPWT